MNTLQKLLKGRPGWPSQAVQIAVKNSAPVKRGFNDDDIDPGYVDEDTVEKLSLQTIQGEVSKFRSDIEFLAKKIENYRDTDDMLEFDIADDVVMDLQTEANRLTKRYNQISTFLHKVKIDVMDGIISNEVYVDSQRSYRDRTMLLGTLGLATLFPLQAIPQIATCGLLSLACFTVAGLIQYNVYHTKKILEFLDESMRLMECLEKHVKELQNMLEVKAGNL